MKNSAPDSVKLFLTRLGAIRCFSASLAGGFLLHAYIAQLLAPKRFCFLRKASAARPWKSIAHGEHIVNGSFLLNAQLRASLVETAVITRH